MKKFMNTVGEWILVYLEYVLVEINAKLQPKEAGEQ